MRIQSLRTELPKQCSVPSPLSEPVNQKPAYPRLLAVHPRTVVREAIREVANNASIRMHLFYQLIALGQRLLVPSHSQRCINEAIDETLIEVRQNLIEVVRRGEVLLLLFARWLRLTTPQVTRALRS